MHVPLLTVVYGFILILIRAYAIISPFSELLGRYQYQRYKIQTAKLRARRERITFKFPAGYPAAAGAMNIN